MKCRNGAWAKHRSATFVAHYPCGQTCARATLPSVNGAGWEESRGSGARHRKCGYQARVRTRTWLLSRTASSSASAATIDVQSRPEPSAGAPESFAGGMDAARSIGIEGQIAAHSSTTPTADPGAVRLPSGTEASPASTSGGLVADGLASSGMLNFDGPASEAGSFPKLPSAPDHGQVWRLAQDALGPRPRAMTQVHASTNVATPGLLAVGGEARRSSWRLGSRMLDARQWARILLCTDLFVLAFASAVSLAAAPVHGTSVDRWLAASFPLAVSALLRLRHAQDDRLNRSILDTVVYVLGVVSLAAMLLIAIDSIIGGTDPVGLAIRLWLFAAVYLGLARACLVSIRRVLIHNPRLATPTLIVGAGVVGNHVVRRLTSNPAYGLRPIGFLDSNPLPRRSGAPTLPVLGGLGDLDEAIRLTGSRHVILAFSGDPDENLVDQVKRCQEMGVGVSLVPRLYEAVNERTTFDHLGGLPLLTLRAVDPKGWQFAVKHAFDRAVAAIVLLLATPVMVALAIGVRLSSPGPILFRQSRVGRDGHEFAMLKFRTMRGDPTASGEADAAWAARILDDVPLIGPAAATAPSIDRTTRFGRFLRDYSLDELPQLINVLRGDMSLVGPRPERVAYVRDFENRVERYADRHRVRSGLTGWAQVNGLRGETSITDRVEWDNFYIQNWSLRFDLRIMALTVAEVLRAASRR